MADAEIREAVAEVLWANRDPLWHTADGGRIAKQWADCGVEYVHGIRYDDPLDSLDTCAAALRVMSEEGQAAVVVELGKLEAIDTQFPSQDWSRLWILFLPRPRALATAIAEVRRGR